MGVLHLSVCNHLVRNTLNACDSIQALLILHHKVSKHDDCCAIQRMYRPLPLTLRGQEKSNY